AGQVDGLVDATRYREIQTSIDGAPVDTGAPVREAAVLALAEADESGDRDVIVERLSEALADPVDRVKCAAIMTLYRLGEASPLADALPRLPTGEGRARVTAGRALLALRAPGSSATLTKALLHREDELALGQADINLVATLIEEEGTPDALSAVIEIAIAGLDHQRSAVAFRAEELIKRLAPESCDLLVVRLQTGRASHRVAVVLGRMKDSRAFPHLVTALVDPDPLVRRASCEALGELRDPAAAEALLVATRDSEYEVRARAGEALDRLGTAAIAVSVASLLRPLMAPPTLPSNMLPATNGHAVPESDDAEWELVLDELEPPAAGPGDSGAAENFG
ncbi:MAG: HEAT repeat domain-containing protein, partial [Propionibacteriaceae bacterium]